MSPLLEKLINQEHPTVKRIRQLNIDKPLGYEKEITALFIVLLIQFANQTAPRYFSIPEECMHTWSIHLKNTLHYGIDLTLVVVAGKSKQLAKDLEFGISIITGLQKYIEVLVDISREETENIRGTLESVITELQEALSKVNNFATRDFPPPPSEL